MAVAADVSGNVYVTGWSLGAGNVYDMVTIKYSPMTPLCGDSDGSGAVNVSDAVYLVDYIFLGGQPPDPLSAGDPNCSGNINISDAAYLVYYIFGGGPAPCAACK